jgi:hypothetical protein
MTISDEAYLKTDFTMRPTVVQDTGVELISKLYGGQDEEKPNIFQISDIGNVQVDAPQNFSS